MSPRANAQPSTRPASQPTTRPSPPNIILLLVDDLAPDMTGFEGNTTVKTPHLDRLAAEGAYFSRCYTPTPQSAPARATVLTGRYPHAHGVTTDGRPLGKNADTFTLRLKKAGYTCGFVGSADLPEEAAKPEFGLTDFVAIEGKRTETAESNPTDTQTRRAVEFLEKFKDRPFFLWISLATPREPLEYPPGGQGQYPPDSLPLPKNMQPKKATWSAKLTNAPFSTRFEQKKADEPALRQDRSKYFAMITRMDEAAGKILERMDQLDLRTRTVVVFASCHGLALGEHGLYGTGPAFFDDLVRGPLLVRWPGMVKNDTKIDRVVGLVDLAPTFLAFAGQSRPFTMQGESLLPLLKNPQLSGHDDQRFFEYDRQSPETMGAGASYVCPARGVVTRNYKFVDYMDQTWSLYDLKRDPEEMDNLQPRMATDASYKRNYNPVLGVLLNGLNDWRRRTHDTGLK